MNRILFLALVITTVFLCDSATHSRPYADPYVTPHPNYSQTFSLKRESRRLQSTVVTIGNLIVRIPGALIEQLPNAVQILSYSRDSLLQLVSEDIDAQISSLCNAVLETNSIRPSYVPHIDEITIDLVNGGNESRSVALSSSEQILQLPKFFPEKNTTIFITGWGFDTYDLILLKLKEAYKCHPTYNFLIIDIGKFIDTVYVWAAFDSETVGNIIGDALSKLNGHILTENIHLLGHGIGAHIAGAAARRFERVTGEKLNRITGLDPSAPCSSTLPGQGLRGLRRGDAIFVDIIHTNNGVFGISTSIGDVDFYPNGVVPRPPRCYGVMCAHIKAVNYYAETVFPGNEDNFLALKCESLKGFTTNQCNGTKIPMGINTPSGAKGDYFLLTNDRPPYGKDISPTHVSKCVAEDVFNKLPF